MIKYMYCLNEGFCIQYHNSFLIIFFIPPQQICAFIDINTEISLTVMLSNQFSKFDQLGCDNINVNLEKSNVQPVFTYAAVSRALLACWASRAVGADYSRTPGLIDSFQGSKNVHCFVLH